MDHYKLRVTWEKTEAKPDNVYFSLKRSCERFAFVDEGGDTVAAHTHYYLVTDLKEATLRKRLREVLGTGERGRGNAVFSLSKLTLTEKSDFCVEYCGYMCKSGNDIVTSDSFPKSWLQEGAEHNRKVQEAKVEEKKTKKKSQIDALRSKFEDDLKQFPEKVIFDRSRQEVDEVDIIRYVYKWWEERGVLIRESTIIAQVQTLCTYYVPSYKEKYMSRILQRIL